MTTTTAVLVALGWLAGVWLLWRVPACRPAPAADHLPVSVVIPARDEERTLPRLLASLGAGPRPAELVVVDDHSADATAAVARRHGATVVASPPLPDGWAGKSWACWTGARATSGDVLVFLDADTELLPGGLARVVAEHRAHGGLLSVQPVHHPERSYEQLSAFFNVVAMMGVGAFTPLRRRVPAGAFGPCLVTSRADYDATGGHRAVAAEVLEDVALSRRFRRAGLPVTCLGGRGTIAFRMYPSGPRQLVEGWTKSIASGAGATRLAELALVFAWISGGILAGTAPALAALRGGGSLAAAVVAYAAYATQLRWMLGRVGRFAGWVAPLFPVPLAVFVGVFARSLALTYGRGEVRWRGRAIRTGRRT